MSSSTQSVTTVPIPTVQVPTVPDEKREDMRVTKRSGKLEWLSFDKILKRIRKSGEEVDIHFNYTQLAMKVIEQLYDKIPTSKIDELSAEQCYSMSSIHPDYAILASRIIHSNHHSSTSDSFSSVMITLYKNLDKHGKSSPLISETLYRLVKKNRKEYDALCQYSRDFLIDYFGFKTLERAYLLKMNKRPIERIQHLWLRVSIGIHGDNLERVKETYHFMSQKYFIHATPTLFNAGTPHSQLSSCYLLSAEDDSIEGIFNTLKDCASISKWGGGIGLHIHNIRATGSVIRGTNGTSNGIVPMLRVFNNTAKYVDQCVLPNTLIYTTQGIKEIQYVTAGETQIYNVQGQVETVANVLEHYYEGDILTIYTAHSEVPLQITGEHPVYVLRKDEWQWVEAKELDADDYLTHVIPTFSVDHPEICYDDCYLYGLLIAGYFTMHCSYIKTDRGIQDFLQRYRAEHIFDFEWRGLEMKEMKEIVWRTNIHLPFRHGDFVGETGHVKIHPKWLNLPVEKSRFILQGIEDSGMDLNGKELKEDLAFLCLKMGCFLEICKRGSSFKIPRTREVCQLLGEEYRGEEEEFITVGEIKVPIIQATEVFKKVDNKLLSRITSIDQAPYRGVLYDLQMTKEHNYMLRSGLVHNGGGKRNGSIAIYLEPWHADIQAFLQMKKNHGEEELKARDLFYALWIPDLFMKRLFTNEKWTLMCPDECPGLSDVWGDEFEVLYEKYEAEGRGRETILARDLWIRILDAQMETGTPYLLYKDTANRKSNQKNIGTIKSSNLCCEIMEYSDGQESAVCNLASIALPMLYDLTSGQFDFDKLHQISSILTYNLNMVIDVNYYPTEKTRRGNMRHRPIGIGIQGLADLFMMMKIPFDSEAAKEMNRHIFETIYHGALTQSCKMAQESGPYETFQGSPASQGILQFDLWKEGEGDGEANSERYDWTALKADICQHGLRNSLLLAPMPTASTSQILGFNECFEPITSNIYSRGTLAGQFLLANKYLMRELIELGLWNEHVKRNIIANEGSIQNITAIPESVRQVYRTVYEIPMKSLIDMAADRGSFICQSQSLNLWLEDPNYKTLTSMHYYAWQKGLKTGIYYLRRRGKHQAQKFTIEPELQNQQGRTKEEELGICDMCSA